MIRITPKISRYVPRVLLLLISTSMPMFIGKSSDIDSKSYQLDLVNTIRARGCYCDGKWMEPVPKISWSKVLEKSALSHAKDMDRYDYFSHYGPGGESIGVRLDAHGYPWAVAGENLGHGQTTFREVVTDWLDSPAHCEMMMHPKVTEMAVVKYKKLWVQHFGARLDFGRRRIGVVRR